MLFPGRQCRLDPPVEPGTIRRMTDSPFTQAQADVQTLSRKPGNDVLLKLYALYKQGSEGDVTGKRPGGFDFVGGAK